jgi:hypothetical protein
MEPEFLQELENAYNRGATIDDIRGILGDDQELLTIAEDFYSKKKESTEGSRGAGLSVSPSEYVEDITESLSTQLDSESKAHITGFVGTIDESIRNGVPIESIRQSLADDEQLLGIANDYYRTVQAAQRPRFDVMKDHWLIIDDNPSELGRLWNRAVAGGILANEIQEGEVSGNINYEKIAYLNSIIQRDAPREEDYLYDTSNPVGSFALDVIRTIPESLISMAIATGAGARGAAAGAGTGAAAGSIIPGAGTAAGATTGAVAGYFGGASLGLEYAHSIMDVLREEGVDVTSPDQLYTATQDAEIMSKAREKGLKRGIPIAVFDAISGGVAGKVGTTLVKSIGKSATNRAAKVAAAETLVQAGLGGTGEFAGQVISGEDIRPRDIALEAFAELGPAAPAMAYNLAGRIGKTPGELSYLDWSKEQNQTELARALETSKVMGGGRIYAIEKEIKTLIKSEDRGTNADARVKQRIRELRNEKYELLKANAERVMSLEEEQRQKVEELTRAIGAEADLINTVKDMSAEDRAQRERSLRDDLNELDNILKTPRPDDTQVSPEEVPSGEQVREEPGRVPESEISRGKAEISRILQAREEDQALTSRHKDVDAAYDAWNKGKKKFFNLFDRNDAAALRRMLDNGEFLPQEERVWNKIILASEARRKQSPNEKYFNVGRGRTGYNAARRYVGFRPSKTSLGATTPSGVDGPVVVMLPIQRESLTGAGLEDRYTPQGTAYHEIFHKIFQRYFDENPVDFNRFRKLVIRRLSESDVKELNEFADLYDEKKAPSRMGAYKSEEFMVQLGGLLGSGRIQFQPTVVEEIKAFLNAIVGKLTGQRVQIFEDAALAKDIAAYMQGMSKAVAAGADIGQVRMSERLQGERFQRVPAEFEAVVEKDEYGFDILGEEATFREVSPAGNRAGIKDPENYDKTFDPVEKVLNTIRPRLNELLVRLEKTLGVDRLRANRRDILQALEVSESINVQHINRFFLALRGINKIVRKMSVEQREEVAGLANDYLFSENPDTRKTALESLVEIDENIVVELGRLAAVRESLQEMIQNSAVFGQLTEDMRQAIKDRTSFYGTRTYRAFTDPNWKFDTQLKRAAEKALVELEVERRIQEILNDPDSNAAQAIAEQPLGDPTNEAHVRLYVETEEIGKIKTKVGNYLRDLEGASAANRSKYGDGLEGSRVLGKLRIPTKKLKQRKDLPIELMEYLGVEKDPYIKFSQTIATLVNMTQQFTLSDRVNEIAQRSNLGDLIINPSVWKNLEKNVKEDFKVDENGVLLERPMSLGDIVQLGRDIGAIESGESIAAFYERIGATEFLDEEGNVSTKNKKEQRDTVLREVYDYFQKNYTKIDQVKSPMYNKYVKNDFVGMLKMTPLYSTEENQKFLQGYYRLLLQMRRVRVLYNLPTWRKNIMGGWYFLAANFVLPYGKERGGLTVMKDLKNRFKKMKEGQVDPELEVVLNRMGELGLLGSSPNMALFGDINDSFMAMINGQNADTAWGWLPGKIKEANNKLGQKAARVAYQYGFIDDYTKMIAYLTKRENFAKRLESNPDGKAYKDLSEAQKQQVDLAVAERIKQNMPTMSRIHPAFRHLFKLPAGDFLSFRVEAFRSFFGIYKNAIEDLREAATNKNLTESQRNAYLLDSVGTLSMGLMLAGLSKYGYQALAGMLLKDDEEEELGMQARGASYVLPPWMQGANIVAVDMDKSGKIRFANMSSEDPYDEIQGLIYGRNGITRSESLMNIAADFKDPNLAVRLLVNLAEGKDSYGRPILNNEDVNWFNRYIIGPSLTEWSDAYGSYIFKETFIPPNMNYIAREYRKRMDEAKENPDIELQPLETAGQLSTALLFRDYPVDIPRQFYYNMQEQNFRTPYNELSEDRRVMRQARLDEVKQAYQFVVNYGTKFGNPKIISNVENTIKKTFNKSPDEMLYILYGIELPGLE